MTVCYFYDNSHGLKKKDPFNLTSAVLKTCSDVDTLIPSRLSWAGTLNENGRLCQRQCVNQMSYHMSFFETLCCPKYE